MSLQDQETAFRASSEAGVIHRSASPHYQSTDSKVYYAVNYDAMRDLLGRLLTQLDAMSLPDRAHKAARTLMVRELWRWWDETCDNSATSVDIAPIVTNGPYVSDGPSNRWGFSNPDEWVRTLPKPTEFVVGSTPKPL